MFQDEYKSAFSKVTASQQTHERIMNMAKKKKRNPSKLLGKVLIAAALISILAVTASASEFSWFTRFFGRNEELTQEQVQFIEDKTQKIEVEPTSHQKPEQDGHKDVLQFVKKMTVCSADQNNTHMTGEGQPSYHDIKLDFLSLSETEARLEYYYYEDMDPDAVCSIPNITVVMKSGEEVQMPITHSRVRVMEFTAESPMDLHQVSYVRLPDGLILYPINSVEDGFDVTLDSILTDGTTAYITLDVTLPDVYPTPGAGWTMDDYPRVTFELYPASQDGLTWEQRLNTRGGTRVMADEEDSDPNTYKQVTEVGFQDNSLTFTSGSTWKIHVTGIQATFHNHENQAIIDQKYAGQDYLIDGEEAARVIDFRQICWDTWDFEFTFAGDEEKIEVLEMVKEPIRLSGLRGTTMEEARIDPQSPGVPYEAELTSFKISPLAYTIEYKDILGGNHAGTFNPGEYTLVMKDGKELTLFQYNGRHSFEEPVILSNIDYLLLPNGEKLSVPD